MHNSGLLSSYHRVLYTKCRTDDPRIPQIVTRKPDTLISPGDNVVLLDLEIHEATIAAVIAVTKLVKHFVVYEVHGFCRGTWKKLFLAVQAESVPVFIHGNSSVLEDIDYSSPSVAQNEEQMKYAEEEGEQEKEQESKWTV